MLITWSRRMVVYVSSEVIGVVRGLDRFWLMRREVMVGEGRRVMSMMSEKGLDASI